MSIPIDRQRLHAVALRLFLERGYDSVSVTEIAAEAGVSRMTFFRHFPTKESVVVEDLFDPAIAGAVATQPSSEPALARVVGGFLAALREPEAVREVSSAQFRERIQIVAATPSLRGAVWASSRDTEVAIREALIGSGTPAPEARTAAGAVMGAATAILLAWAAEDDPTDAAHALSTGLASLVGRGR